MEMSDPFNLRYQDRCCLKCRYYREHKTGAWTSECLLIGRTLGIAEHHNDLFYWALSRVCDGFKKRPGTWTITSEGTDKNPHWVDQYIPRERLERLRNRFLKGKQK